MKTKKQTAPNAKPSSVENIRPQLAVLEIAKIIPDDEGNGRVLDVTSLRESMGSEVGQITPIAVIETADDQERVRVVAGRRRLKAATELGWQTIACRIYPEGTPLELIRMVAAAENIERLDLDVFQEVDAIAKSYEALGDAGTVKRIAELCGHSATWVRDRLALTRLVDEFRKLAAENPEDWPIASLAVVAAMPADFQRKLAGRGVYIHPNQSRSPQRIADFLDEFRRKLSAATWDLDDAELDAKAGACSTCPKKSGAGDGDLFPVLDVADSHCCDSDCWARKLVRSANIKAAALAEKHDAGKPLLLAADYRAQQTLKELAPGGTQTGSTWDFQKVKAGTPGARPAVELDDERKPKTVFVLPKKGAETVDGKEGKKKAGVTKERRAALKRKAAAVRLFVERIKAATPPLRIAAAFACSFGTNEKDQYGDNGASAGDLAAHLDQDGDDVAASLWSLTFPVVSKFLQVRASVEREADALFKRCEWIAAGLQLSAEWLADVKAAEESIDLPKKLGGSVKAAGRRGKRTPPPAIAGKPRGQAFKAAKGRRAAK